MKPGSIVALVASVVVSVIATHSMLGDIIARRAQDEASLGHVGTAERLDRRALWFDPRSDVASASLVRLERESGRVNESVNDATSFLVHAGYSKRVLAERGRSLFALKQYAAAGGDFESIVRRRDGNGMDALFGIYSLRRVRRFAEARALARQALAFHPGDKRLQAYASLGQT